MGIIQAPNIPRPKPHDEADEFHYKFFGKILKEKLETFANKYNLFINID